MFFAGVGSGVCGVSSLGIEGDIDVVVVVGLICGGGVFCWRYRQWRRSVTDTAGVTDRPSDTVDGEARWEGEGGALLSE